MSQEVTTTGKKELSSFDPQQVRESQEIAGQGGGTFIPFIPILEVNNKAEKKKAMIDGVEKEVEVPAKKGFIITKRDPDTREYSKAFHDGDLHGVILKERFQIEKKYDPESKAVQYKSDEFEGWNSVIRLYNKFNRKETVAEGVYSELKDMYTSEIKDKNTGEMRKEKDFDLYFILYINYEVTGEVFRLKAKMTMDNKWFEYKNSFLDNEPWAGYVTNFNLVQKTRGDNTYWHLEFERGQTVNLGEQLKIQREINKYFTVTDLIRTKKAVPMEGVQPEPESDEQVIQVEQDEFEDDSMKVAIDQIPF